ncbi:MAG: diaminobutyrate--2-oxoglutarate transaminase [Ruminococcaceae bacterium]|nr:diaminobutyrate--2-oxoglutarate transaminase [Oscillospiraceae bacterium]
MFEIFEEKESNVRSYCRKYPTIFKHAKNAEMYSEDETRYIDFLSVAGSINYGHNNPDIKKEILNYLSEDNIINAMDMYTTAKAEFLDVFNKRILKPRNLNYKIMCCGPTGTNAVEAALKLARKNTKRTEIIAFSGAFHGMSLGSLSVTTDKVSREGAGVALNNVTFVPYDGSKINSIEYINEILSDDHSGIEKPAAIILETVQAEGGVNVASVEWLKEIRRICTENNILMIVDDIQVGNGRTGTFFSFERANIIPDMVVMSKSISGFGMPMALLFIKPELDIFRPAEHNGTFRGNQLSFVGATAAVNYFVDNSLDEVVKSKARIIEDYIKTEICPIHKDLKYRGIGMLWGIDFSDIDSTLALKIVHKAFDNGLIVEVAGRKDSVLKIMPPLTVEESILIEGLSIIKSCIFNVLKERYI